MDIGELIDCVIEVGGSMVVNVDGVSYLVKVYERPSGDKDNHNG